MADDRLESWKEIAAYLKRDVATVRRWEKREGLPVHRHLHQKLGSVYAFTLELNAWQERRSQVVTRPPRTLRMPVLLVAIGIVLVTAAAAYLFRDSVRNDSRPTIRLAMHRPGTVASLVAAGLQAVLHRAAPDVDVRLVEQPGMIQTLRAMSEGTVDIGLAFNLLAFHAAKTEQLLGRPSANITAVTVAYVTPAQVVVRQHAPISTIDDLRGRRVSFGIVDSGEQFCSQVVLGHLGLAAEDIVPHFIDFAPSLDALRANQIDDYITWRGMPVPDVAHAFESGDFRLIPIEGESLQGLRLKHPFLFPWTIPARVYLHQTSTVPTVGARMLVLAARSLSPELVERILRAVDAYLPDIIARHPAAAKILIAKRPTLEEGLSIDLHPGAELFFRAVATVAR